MDGIRQIRIIALLAAAILLCLANSCEYDSPPGHNKVVLNNSDSNLLLVIEQQFEFLDYGFNYDSLQYTQDSNIIVMVFQIPSKSEKTIYSSHEIGSSGGAEDCRIESGKIWFDSTTLLVKKDIMDWDNWNLSNNGQYGADQGSMDCVFEIGNKDVAGK